MKYTDDIVRSQWKHRSCVANSIIGRPQNLPSHDKTWTIKNVYAPPTGAILCATDYSFVELVCLAQSCYTRFNQSTLRDVINADVDPHYWFAGVRDGLITNDTSFIHSPQKIADLKKFLEENISKEARQHAKMANPKLALQGAIPVEKESELLEGRVCA